MILCVSAQSKPLIEFEKAQKSREGQIVLEIPKMLVYPVSHLLVLLPNVGFDFFFCVCVLCPIVDNFCLTGIEVNTTNEEGHKEWWTSTNREAIIHTQRNAMRLCQRFLPAWQRYGAKVVLVYMGFGSDVVALTNNIDFEGVLCAVVKITWYFTSFIIISSIYRLCLFNVLQSAKCVVLI